MLRLIVFLLFLIVSVWFGISVVRHPGFLLLVYQPWTVQMPLWFALLGALIFLCLFYLFIVSIDRTQFLFFRVKNWLRFRREHKAYSKTQRGLATLIEGRFKRAESLLLSGVKQSIDPLINYLAAAKAAHLQKAYERRDAYIQSAYQIAPKADLAIGLTQAEFELEQDQLEQATATLQRLRAASPKHPQVLKLLEKVYVRLGDWKNLETLLPSLQKAKVIAPDQAVTFEKHVNVEILKTNQAKTLADLKELWDNVPRSMKKQPDVVVAYVNQLARFNDHQEMAEQIRKILKTHWQPELVKLYGTLPFANLDRQLVIVGAWLKIYGPQPETLLTLGRLCARIRLWGKAKDYFEKCLAQGPNAEASLEYGKLLEQLGNTEEAAYQYREGLSRLA